MPISWLCGPYFDGSAPENGLKSAPFAERQGGEEKKKRKKGRLARNVKLGCPEHLGMEDPTVISDNFTFSLSLLLSHNTKVAYTGFPDSSIGKESCSAGDPGSLLRLGRSARERIGYPL